MRTSYPGTTISNEKYKHVRLCLIAPWKMVGKTTNLFEKSENKLSNVVKLTLYFMAFSMEKFSLGGKEEKNSTKDK